MSRKLVPTGAPNITHGENGQCVGVPVWHPDGKRVLYEWTHLPSCRIGRILDGLPSPRDEFAYLWNAPAGFEPAEQAERMPG